MPHATMMLFNGTVYVVNDRGSPVSYFIHSILFYKSFCIAILCATRSSDDEINFEIGSLTKMVIVFGSTFHLFIIVFFFFCCVSSSDNR